MSERDKRYLRAGGIEPDLNPEKCQSARRKMTVCAQIQIIQSTQHLVVNEKADSFSSFQLALIFEKAILYSVHVRVNYPSYNTQFMTIE